MARPVEADIRLLSNGFYRLDCDGRHDPDFHLYLYYTKKEIMKMWRAEHPRGKENTDG